MGRFLAAVIDDDFENREGIYTEILSEHFEIQSFSEESLFLREGQNKHYDMLVIDNLLDGWSTSTLELFLRKYPELTRDGTPIVAVSRHWHKNQGEQLYMGISNIIREYPIIMIVTWDDLGKFPTETDLAKKWKDTIRENIYVRYLQHCGLRSPLRKDDDAVILQLSDMQFGAETERGAYADTHEIAEKLRIKSMRPSIVVVCGDISESGKTSEFEQAELWMRDLASKIEPEIAVSQFVFTVGNHDCDFSSFATLKYKFNFGEEISFSETEKTDWRIDKNKYITSEEFLFSNFLLFEKQCSPDTGSAVYKTKKLNTVDDSYLNWGIRFISLNTVSEISPDNVSGIGVDKDELHDIINHCNKHRNEDIYTILITHYSPYDLGYKSGENNKQNLWADIMTFLSNSRIKLWLCGHSHGADAGKIEEKGIKIAYSKSSSLRLPRDKLAPNAQRGYNTITLKRENGVVVDAIVEINCI